MLTPEERQEIEAEFPRYPHKQAVCLDAMKIIQRHRGWVSDESLRDLGEVLDMTPEELDGVATFYNLIFRRPVGRHVVLICDSVSCWIMGYGKTMSASHLAAGSQSRRDHRGWSLHCAAHCLPRNVRSRARDDGGQRSISRRRSRQH